jgi:hypothetical protein
MAKMRESVLAQQEAANRAAQAKIESYHAEAVQLASALARLEAQQAQLRDLNATLLAEQVYRKMAEQKAASHGETLAGIKNELATAIRALRSARNDAKMSEEERAGLKRSYDIAQNQ